MGIRMGMVVEYASRQEFPLLLGGHRILRRFPIRWKQWLLALEWSAGLCYGLYRAQHTGRRALSIAQITLATEVASRHQDRKSGGSMDG